MRHLNLLKKMAAIPLSLIFILAFALPPAAVTAQAEDEMPLPTIEVFAWFDRVTLINWPAGVPVDVSIDGIVQTVTPDVPEGRYDFYPGMDLQPGMTITASNDTATKVLKISPLSGSVVSAATGKVKGDATPGQTFHMQTTGDHFQNPVEQDITADWKGKWSATIPANLPWEWLILGYMWETDEDGDVTYAIWHVNQPIIEVWLVENTISAYDWPVNTELTFKVNGEVIGKASTEPVDWYDGTMASLNAGDLRLEPGMKVTVSDEDVSKSTIVQDIKITNIDAVQDRVYGVGPTNAHLELRSWEDSPVFRFFNAGSDGNWEVDYQQPSPNGVTVDLNGGDPVWLFMRDGEKDSTVWSATTINPWFLAFPNGQEEVFVNDFPVGASIHLTIDDPATEIFPDIERDAEVEPGEPSTFVRFGFQGEYDLKPGDEISVTDGTFIRTHTIRNMGISSVRIYDNTVAGWADSGTELQVWAHGYDQSGRTATANENGQWEVNFNPFQLQFGMCGRAQITDDQGNGTAQDWCIPNANIKAFPNDPERIHADNFPEGGQIHLTIDDPTTEPSPDYETTSDPVPASGSPAEPWTNVTFNLDQYDLKVGDFISIDDGTTTRTHTVLNVGITEVNEAANTAAGWADPGAEVEVWAHGYGDSSRKVSAGDDGHWFVDFNPFDLQYGMCGMAQVVDADGNATGTDWCLPNIQEPVTISVSSTEDVLANDGVCTLREAVIAANTNSPSGDLAGECPGGSDQMLDTILLLAGQTYSLTRDRTGDTPEDGDLDIWDNASGEDLVVTVQGEGKANISQDAPNWDDRVFVNYNGTARLENLILTGGATGGGGGLANAGTMYIVGCEVYGNTTDWDGGGIVNYYPGTMTIEGSFIHENTTRKQGGGIANYGTLIVNNSEVRANISDDWGGGIFNEAGASLVIDHSTLAGNRVVYQGGGLYNIGTATIQNDTVVGGTKPEDANVGNGGGLFNLGSMTVNDSLITGNAAIDPGSPDTHYGGGLFNWIGGTLTLSSSTVSNNKADEGGGLHNKDGATAYITNGSIISDNFATWSSGGIDNWGTITITDSVLRNNNSDGVGDAIGGSPDSQAAITSSCLIGNGVVAVFNYSPTYTWNAAGNWWGSSSGPTSWMNPLGTGDSVEGDVDFSNWLTEPPAVCQ